MAKKFFGFITFSDCYHSSPDCPVMKHVTKSTVVELKEYESERGAILSGHKRRCRLCLGDKVFAINTRDRVHMSDEQYAVLKAVVEIYKKTGEKMTLRQISELRKRSVVSTYLIIKRLRSDGLVEHALKIGGKRASGGTIAPTQRGLTVARSQAMPESWTE